MNSKEAKALRDEIKAAGIHCVIPRGRSLPTIYSQIGTIEFSNRAQWIKYVEVREAADQWRLSQSAGSGRGIPRPRSPIDAMIDAACGIGERHYSS